MVYEPKMIAPWDQQGGGLFEYYKPWLIGDNAFQVFDNAYSWRGSIRKREGFEILAPVGLTIAATVLNTSVAGNPTIINTSAPHGLSTGNYVSFQGVTGTASTLLNGFSFQITVLSPTSFSIPVDTTGLTFLGAGTIALNQLVQGLKTYYVPSSGDEQLIALTKTNAFLYNNFTQVFDNISFFQTSSAPITWTGGNDDFFWASNFANALWTTNFVDSLRFWNGTSAAGWNNQRPTLNGTNLLLSCLLVIPYKGRLIVLNTTEGVVGTPVSYRQRARWSQLGTPYVPATAGDPVVVPPVPFVTDASAWRDDTPGRGGFIDADTNERIVSAGIIRDTLIVFFQRSTWRLQYTGNEILPFIWQRINTQYGAESPMSIIVFDDGILAFSRYGYVMADTNSVQRIDRQIPDQTFVDTDAGNTFKNLQRVQGVRDYYREVAYWCYPTPQQELTPNRVLAYNFLEKSWARYNHQFRCFGHYKEFNDLTWASSALKEPVLTWSNNNNTWSGPGNNADFPIIIAGDNVNGNVYLLYDSDDNATDISQSNSQKVNFNFRILTKRFNPYIQEGHRAKLGYLDLYVTRTENGQITCNHYVDDEDEAIYSRTVNIDSTNNQLPTAKYVRIFLGAIARVHQLEFILSPSQLADNLQGKAQFEIQGMVLWFRREGRLKG